MKAYKVHDGEPDYVAYLVFADNRDQAIFLAGRARITAESEYIEAAEIECNGPEPRYPGVCEDEDMLREAGFHREGDERCGTCGLAEMGGEYPVCPDCTQCTECGCSCNRENNKEKCMEPEWLKWCSENMPPNLFQEMENSRRHDREWRDALIEEQRSQIEELKFRYCEGMDDE